MLMSRLSAEPFSSCSSLPFAAIHCRSVLFAAVRFFRSYALRRFSRIPFNIVQHWPEEVVVDKPGQTVPNPEKCKDFHYHEIEIDLV
jgi:hypothetical protein